MIVAFRTAVADVAATVTGLPVERTVPDDVAHVPCVVVGRVAGAEADEPVVENLELDLTLIARRQRADDPLAVGGELDEQCDAVYLAFGGTRGTRANGWALNVTSRRPLIVAIGALEYEAYALTVEGSHTTCQ